MGQDPLGAQSHCCAGRRGHPVFPAPGDRAVCGQPQVGAVRPQLFPRENPQWCAWGGQAQLAHLQEEETGPERGSDWPQVTQPAYGRGKAGVWPFKPGLRPLGWSLGMSSTCGKSSKSSQHFPEAEALRAGPPAVPAAVHTTPGECWAPFWGCPCGDRLWFLSGRGRRHEEGVQCWTWSQTVRGRMRVLSLTNSDLRRPVPQLLHL